MSNPIRSNPGILYALVTAFGLGAITTQAKIFYADGGNALTLMLTRFALSTLVFGLLLLLRRARFGVKAPLRLPLALIGLIWSGSMICYLIAVESLSVSLAVLILYFYPLLVLGYALASRQLRPSVALFGLFCAAFTGIYMALSGNVVSISPVGILFAALASCGAAFTFICGARVAPALSPLLLTFWVNAVGLIMILPLIYGKLALPESADGSLALALATLFYLVAILSQFQALSRLSAARAAFLLNLEPVVSIVLASLVLNESLSPIQISGVILVIGVVMLSLRFRPAGA